MTPSRWIIVGLVTAVALFATGAFLGYGAGTSSDAEHATWEARTDSLMNEERKLFRARIAGHMARADSAEARAAVSADRARRAEAGRAQANAVAGELADQSATIAAALALVTERADSVAGLVQLVHSVQGELEQAKQTTTKARAEADDWKAAYDEQLQATAGLRARIATDSVRIIDLEDQLVARPKPKRDGFTLLGIDFEPCGAAIIGTRGADVGIGVCGTP